MRIGIDISQIVYEGTGVGAYVRRMVRALLALDRKNDYILFGSSFRKKYIFEEFLREMKKEGPNVSLVSVAIPPTLLDILWNRLHVIPVEKLTGPLDIFWSSDWTQPPLSRAKGITTIHDLIAISYPQETHARTELKGTRLSPNIVATQKRRLAWVQKECAMILCDSQSTKRDVMRLLGIPAEKLRVVYPGVQI